MQRRLLSSLPIVTLAIFLSGCATIVNGSRQNVTVNSNPPGATVTIDNVETGQTPITVEMERGSHHTVQLDLDGYEPQTFQTSRGVSGWLAGSLLMGVVPVVVDLATGSMYKLSPNQINAKLAPVGATEPTSRKTIEDEDDDAGTSSSK